jgi:micrococcal nuclease
MDVLRKCCPVFYLIVMRISTCTYSSFLNLRILKLPLFVLLLSVQPAFSQRFEGKIIRILKGDTFIFLAGTEMLTVRMLGVEAPERDQPFSREAAQFLSKYLNKDAVAELNGTDRDDRYIGILYVNGKDINLLSLRGGYSWHNKRYSSDKKYAEAEEYAQKNKLNIWSMPKPIAPWVWRQKHSGFTDREQEVVTSDR